MTASDLYQGLLGMGITKGYASQLARGERKPSMALAIRIYRAIGAKIGPIENLPKSAIVSLEKAGGGSAVQ